MPDMAPEAQTSTKPAEIRADIAKMVGLDLEKAAAIAKQRDQEAEVVRICKNNASETYNRLKTGEEVDLINLGIGKFDLSPTDNIRDLLTNFKKRIEEQLAPAPFSINDLAIDGNDIMKELGIKPGPKIGEILQKLFEEVDEDLSKNARDILLKRVKEIS